MAKKTPTKRRNPAEHLKQHQFKKGCKPGPGRPKGTALSDAARVYITREKATEIIEGIVQKAANGDAACAKLLFDRLEGPLKQEIAAEISTGELTEEQAAAVLGHITELSPEPEGE